MSSTKYIKPDLPWIFNVNPSFWKIFAMLSLAHLSFANNFYLLQKHETSYYSIPNLNVAKIAVQINTNTRNKNTIPNDFHINKTPAT